MDLQQSPTPVTITEYCNTFGFSLKDIRLPCTFCRFYLTIQDLASFELKQFRLLWKGPFCYACCRSCMRLTAAFEVRKHYQCSCSCLFLEDLLGRPLQHIPMRCLLCLALLDYAEKLQHFCVREDFVLVRGNWRGYCRNCIRKE
ncbi:transforming protein E6 [Human papillomavirus 121]|uniref:Protein E6 n=1 Tax=Human papillomavirus 121 TaxID=915429 RepID=D7P173_9PAPI|nr:transforming protein E6 [Human papillomavirus 121]ADH29805.1 transforming protein E6 [Human papillomavirus 121]